MPRDDAASSNWVALPGSQALVLACPVREVLYHGTRGPGKTETLLMDFAQHVGRGFGSHWRGVLFRRTYKQLDDVIVKARRWFPRFFTGARYNASDYAWTWPGGEALLLRHMATPDDYWNYHGHEYPWIGWDELTNWLDLACYDAMKSCNRSAHPTVPRRIRGTTNPWGRGHNVVKRRFIDPAPDGKIIVDALSPDGRVAIHGSIEENLILMHNDPGYVAQLEAIEDKNKRAAWRYGSWDISSGGMFDDLWDARVHRLSTFDVPRGWVLDRGHDWGSSRPSATLWFAESDGVPFEETIDGKKTGRERWFPRGHLVVADELYTWTGKENEGTRLPTPKIAQKILERELGHGWRGRVKPGPADSSIYTAEPGERSIAQRFEDAGVRFTPSYRGPGSRVNGWQLVRDLLAASLGDETGRQEEPGLSVMDRCRQVLRTFPSAPRDETDPDDVDTESEDHVPDVIRYKALARKHVVKVEELRA